MRSHPRKKVKEPRHETRRARSHKRKYKWRRLLIWGLKPSSIDWQESKPSKSRTKISLHCKKTEKALTSFCNSLMSWSFHTFQRYKSASTEKTSSNWRCKTSFALSTGVLRPHPCVCEIFDVSLPSSDLLRDHVCRAEQHSAPLKGAVRDRIILIRLQYVLHIWYYVDLWPRLACPTFGCCWTPGKLGWSASISSVHVPPSDSVLSPLCSSEAGWSLACNSGWSYPAACQCRILEKTDRVTESTLALEIWRPMMTCTYHTCWS